VVTFRGSCGLGSQGAADPECLLGRAAVDELEALGGGEEAVGLTVQVDADPAVDVNGGVGEPVAGVGRPQLGDRQLGLGR
jgi:hypothetical protein